MTATLQPPVNTTTASRHFSGAPLLPPAIAYAVLALAAIALPSALAGVSAYSAGEVVDFFRNHVTAARLGAFLPLAASVPFAVFTAVATARLRAAGVDVPGRSIAKAGGIIAAAMLAVSGLGGLALTQPHATDDPAVVHAVYGLVFATGGPGFVVFSGLLLAGLAVPMLAARMVPRWLGFTGLALAAVAELSSLTVATDLAQPLLPVGRFGALLWLLAVAVTLRATANTDARRAAR